MFLKKILTLLEDVPLDMEDGQGMQLVIRGHRIVVCCMDDGRHAFSDLVSEGRATEDIFHSPSAESIQEILDRA